MGRTRVVRSEEVRELKASQRAQKREWARQRREAAAAERAAAAAADALSSTTPSSCDAAPVDRCANFT